MLGIVGEEERERERDTRGCVLTYTAIAVDDPVLEVISVVLSSPRTVR